jgi:glycosyltransferase involved in cell wall biosynthesis
MVPETGAYLKYQIMKVLLLSRYGKLGASSRYRSYQYLLFLQNDDIEITSMPLLDDAYLTARYDNQPLSLLKIANAYVKRFISLLGANRYDLLWIEYELFSLLPAWFEQTIGRITPYIVDYDDAIFHNYDRHPNPVIRKLLGKKIDRVMASAAIVTVGNSYLAQRAIKAGAKRVEILPTVINLDRYPLPPVYPERMLTIGWIGSPTTTKHLQTLESSFQAISKKQEIQVVAIGASEIAMTGVNLKIVRWQDSTEVQELQQLDIGVMPLLNEPWEQGKCGFKLIQYMAAGVPCIASPVGVNTEIIEHGVNGFLASTPAEWITAFQTLIDNPDLRKQMGIAGRKKVEREYCLQVTAPKLAKLLKAAATR